MTFFHFANCLALTYAPYFISYKYSGLSEYSSVWKCAQAAFAYLFTQLAKFLILATFFPAGELEGQRFDLVAEFMKSTVDVVDLIGLHAVIAYALVGKGEIRFLAAGLGWATAESLASRLQPFWMGAKGPGFDWKYTQMGLESNLNLVFYMSVAALVWLWMRTDLQWQMKQATGALLLYATYRNFIYEILFHVVGLDSWTLLAVKMVLTLGVALSTVVIYGSLRPAQQNYHR
uniref:BOS complex subunit TMEM147 n=1 Tax=Plectus sambesii TaxID=2011161 RepID=A0A914WW20_9BILA